MLAIRDETFAHLRNNLSFHINFHFLLHTHIGLIEMHCTSCTQEERMKLDLATIIGVFYHRWSSLEHGDGEQSCSFFASNRSLLKNVFRSLVIHTGHELFVRRASFVCLFEKEEKIDVLF